MSAKTVLGLCCVISLAVMVGMVGAGVFFWSMYTVASTAAEAAKPVPTGYTEPMRPVPVRIEVPGTNDYPMSANQDGSGATYPLSNGTEAQILQVEGEMVRIQVMSGPHEHRSGWLHRYATTAR